MNNYKPELDQLYFDQPWGKYEIPLDLELALQILSDYWDIKFNSHTNPFQNTGVYNAYKNNVFEVIPYSRDECWCENECICGHKPQQYNFKYKNIEVSWYKYIGREMSVNRIVSQEEIQKILDECLKSLMGEKLSEEE